MKPKLKFVVCILLIGTEIFVACNKQKPISSIVVSPHDGHTPIARAGVDQTITMPANTAILDGNASSDPDNNISGYNWIKISGPSSFTIVNAQVAQTQIKNLVQGVYLFELKVMDAGGLFSKDTVSVFVNSADGSCQQSGVIYIAQGNACMTPFGKLSLPGMAGIASAGNKILFSIYNPNNGSSLDIYDTTTRTWSTANNNFGIHGPVVGNKIVSPGLATVAGQQVDIYDASSSSWSTVQLSEPIGPVSVNAVVGSKVFFAGGQHPDSNWAYARKKINIYDAVSNSWSILNFNEARGGMSAVSFGNKIFFAGGFIIRYDSLVLYCDDDGNNCYYEPAIVKSNRVDVYDVSTNSWALVQLSESCGGVVAKVGNKILFAGGGVSGTRLDFYDASTNTWSTTQLNQNPGARAHTVGNKVLFTGSWSNIVNIYDAVNNSWSAKQMTYPNGTTDYLVASASNKILFFNVFDKEDYQMHLDMFDASTNSWAIAELNRGLSRSGIIAAGNQIYIAGGIIGSIGNFGNDFRDDVWRFQFK